MPAEGAKPAEGESGRVFAVDDERELLNGISRTLRASNFSVRTFTEAAAVLEALEEAGGEVDVLLTDLYMPNMDGMDLLKEVRSRFPNVGILMMTGAADVASAVEAMRLGAYDYLVKPFDPRETLIPAVGRAAERAALLRRNRYLERQVDLSARFEEVVGSSRRMREVFSLVESVAPTDVTVLVLGASGTGKELIARAIHKHSQRSARPLIDINCGALAEDVLESELFGHVRGAFTGAATSRRGLFEEASGGTLFLDEVGELSPATQVRLLRVLQEGRVRPVGSNESREVDVRVIAATNRPLAQEVQQGRFREDLFYRLNVVSIELPTLSQRPEDIPMLCDHFLRKHATRLNRAVTRVGADAMQSLCRRPWPGNVRELENVMARAVVLARGETITADLVPEEPVLPNDDAAPDSRESGLLDLSRPMSQARSEFERRYIERALEAADGNVAEAARISGLDPSNLRRLLKRHGLKNR